MSRIRRRVKGRAKAVLETDENSEENIGEDDILQARSTIERLARKYLLKSPGDDPSLDIVRTDSLLQEERATQLSSPERPLEQAPHWTRRELNLRLSPVKITTHNKPDKTRRRKRRPPPQAKKTPLSPPNAQLPTLTSPPNSQLSTLTSPTFKIPKPTMGHSTPGELPVPRRDSLFGFDVLESPLTLSPVPATSYVETPSKSSPQESLNVSRSSIHTRIPGTYDVQLRRPTPQKKHGRKKTKKCSSEVDKLIKELNSEFAQVDDFELAVE